MVDPSKERFGCRPINIGTGLGTTVLEMVAAMEKACGHAIAKEFAPRRQGDTEAVRSGCCQQSSISRRHVFKPVLSSESTEWSDALIMPRFRRGTAATILTPMFNNLNHIEHPHGQGPQVSSCSVHKQQLLRKKVVLSTLFAEADGVACRFGLRPT
jgi:hypothetical protein